MKHILIAALTLILGAASSGQEADRPSHDMPFAIDLANVKWTSLDNAAQYSILQVDPISGATQMLWRLAANAKSPCHWHSASESNVVVQGSVVMQHLGMPDSTLGVGGFSFVPKAMKHKLSTGPTTTIVFSSLGGRFDFHPVDDSQCVANGS
jgi:hypothetical protein